MKSRLKLVLLISALLTTGLCLPISAWSMDFAIPSGARHAPSILAPAHPRTLAANFHSPLSSRAMDTRSALLDFRADLAARGEMTQYNRVGNVNLYLLLVMLLFAVTRRALHD